MEGKIIHVATNADDGFLRAEDGNRYPYSFAAWASPHTPAIGSLVDFEIEGERATSVYGVPGAEHANYSDGATPPRRRIFALAIAGGLAALALGGVFAFNSGAFSSLTAASHGPLKTLYALRLAKIRNLPTTDGSVVVGELKRGQNFHGRIYVGKDGQSQWIKREDAEEYVSVINLVDSPPPAIVEAVNSSMPVSSDLPLFRSPSTASPLVTTLKSGEMVKVSGKIAGGWAEATLSGGDVAYFQVPSYMFAPAETMMPQAGVPVLDGADSPTAVIVAYGTALQNGDSGGILAVLDPRVRQSAGSKLMMALGEMQRQARARGGIVRVSASNVVENGDYATGTSLVDYANGQYRRENLRMVRLNGRWYAQVGG